jgi:hypothetical protein
MLEAEPSGALVPITPTVRLAGATAAVERDRDGVAWVALRDRRWHRPVGESTLTAYRVPATPSLWVLAGTYSDLPEDVRLWELAGEAAAVRLAGAADAWVALVDAAPRCRLTAEWRRDQDATWQRKALPPLGEIASDGDVLWYA